MAGIDHSLLFGAMPVEDIFDCLSDTVFVVKDTQGCYVLVNDTLVMRAGKQTKSQLIGKTPSEVMGKLLGRSYEKQDAFVLQTGRKITDQLEMHIYNNRSVGWCITNKRAVTGPDQSIIGVVGISQDIRQPDMSHEDLSKISSVLSYVKENPSDPLNIKYLSNLASLSPYQLDRRIQGIFGLTTGQWVLKHRLDLAREQLLETETSIAEIALNVGYADQSTFARQFRKTTGLSPSHFRAVKMDA